jgi:high-affinity Fe2+/Pb2+ permease
MSDNGDPTISGGPPKSLRLNLIDVVAGAVVAGIVGFFLFVVFSSITW